MSQNSPKSRAEIRRGRQFTKKKGPFRRIIKYLLILFGLIILFGAGLFTFYAASAPQITRSALSSDNSTKFYDANGQVISRLGSQNRDYVKAKNIPRTLKQAVVSIEDRRFYKHHGVDPIRIIGATISNITGSSLGLQGGSTLTQQLVKLSVFSTAASDRTLKRKAQEAWLALKVERHYSKSQILEFYINKVYMGNGVYGMQTASEFYYNKTLKHLTLPEFALLAGMPQSPTLYNPYKYPKYATERRDEVLNAMVKNKVITQQQAQNAKSISVKRHLSYTHSKAQTAQRTSKYIDSYLKQSLEELHNKGYKQNSGLKVYTNLDLSAQKKLYNVANGTSSGIVYPSNRFQIGATLVNPNNGKVLAMQGGRKIKVAFGLNRAVQTGRSSGSTAKPIMDYGPAIQYLKYPTYQPVKDTPYTYAGSDKSVMDFDNKYQGTITMRKALVESRNIPAIRTLENVGVPDATKFLKNLGMSFSKPLELQNGIGLYISSEQLAASYAAFSNGGTYYKPYLIRKVVQPNGVSHAYHQKGKRAMSPATAFMITNMLKGVMADANGSGTAAKVSGLFEAGKTGTTQYPDDYINQVPADSSMDSWFSGFTKNYSLAIWTGYDHQFKANSYITPTQTTIAQQIYKSVMGYISTNKPNVDWTKPDDVVATDRGGQTEYYVAGYPGTVADNSSNQTDSGYTVDSGSSSDNTTITQPRSNESSDRSDRTTESSQTPTTQEPNGDGGDSSDASSSSASSSSPDTGGNTTNNNGDSTNNSPDSNAGSGSNNDTTTTP
ncbi:PBP1A family penicillin-binding protein [Lentilactobacillus kisonensis]|uniref:Penicillin-binding protein, 1A family n=2 Tax=Lentilactobacillus kisonensis TaxID=481722 RepID=H1LG78_9LACO|nr:PBP1A family penicillin-binding protein [Lentilactobacillus kisonensis]EHO51090.1 penicillin-binding protein, 1A family [Lentilactobacillus kisonensis F0435]KRL23405.1 penicillin-binding protein, 1A family [Lentilactobacillus kisonensis DSM 19906 = JCM 15041]